MAVVHQSTTPIHCRSSSSASKMVKFTCYNIEIYALSLASYMHVVVFSRFCLTVAYCTQLMVYFFSLLLFQVNHLLPLPTHP